MHEQKAKLNGCRYKLLEDLSNIPDCYGCARKNIYNVNFKIKQDKARHVPKITKQIILI